MNDDEAVPDYAIVGHPAQIEYDRRFGTPSPRYRPFLLSGHTLLVQRRLTRWCWSVEYPDGSTIYGWTFSKRGAYRAAFHLVPR